MKVPKPPKMVKVKRAAPIDQDWERLSELINVYRDMAILDSWKGGGDPEDYEVVELRLKLASMELQSHIAKMKRAFS